MTDLRGLGKTARQEEGRHGGLASLVVCDGLGGLQRPALSRCGVSRANENRIEAVWTVNRDDLENEAGLESSMNVDVTTWRTTPRMGLSACPSATLDRVNGGVRRIVSWDVLWRAIPNRCLSVLRHTAPCSFQTWRDRDLPPPRALGTCGSPPTEVPAEMGRSTDTDGDGNLRTRLPQNSPNFMLDSNRFIDAPSFAQQRVKNDSLARWVNNPPPHLSEKMGHSCRWQSIQGDAV